MMLTSRRMTMKTKDVTMRTTVPCMIKATIAVMTCYDEEDAEAKPMWT